MKIATSLTLAAALVLTLLGVSPTRAIAAGCVAGQTEYTVRTGDWLKRIGESFKVDWREIARINSLANPNRIFPGQKLCIPAAAPTPTRTSTAGPSPTPTRTSTPRSPTATAVPFIPPTFGIVKVIRDTSVTIQTANFPARQTFTARMGAMGTRGIGGTVVGSLDSGGGGSFSATFNIPAGLRGARQIAIRLDSPQGYFAYNWFWNNSTP
jgi:hypothetical protein